MSGSMQQVLWEVAHNGAKSCLLILFLINFYIVWSYAHAFLLNKMLCYYDMKMKMKDTFWRQELGNATAEFLVPNCAVILKRGGSLWLISEVNQKERAVWNCLGTQTYVIVKDTLGPKMFGVGDFWLKIRVTIKISTQPCR